MIGIGIDTGGTYTDAVIYDMEEKRVLGKGKALTTRPELEAGIANALDTLPEELVRKAELLTLSTTLATNACVEDKGARAKLLLIGFDASMIDRLRGVYASYGFYDTSQFVVIDAKPENLFSQPYDPDWKKLEKNLPEYFGDCAAVGIVQKHPRANGGRFEKTAKALLEEHMELPVTLAYDISDEVDILKCCAGTMLNARLIPLIADFISAVKHVMDARGMRMPIAIVRSDGSVMSEEMAKECPVETLLSGPAASVVGGSALAGAESAWIIDMGGTTTDIALLREREPVMADGGIRIGQWKTMVRGLYVDTFGLGGDSAVRYRKGQLYLDTARVIPLSVLAAEYPRVVTDLENLAAEKRSSAKWIHEFYVLLKDISRKSGYTEEEKEICRALKHGPLITRELAARMNRDVYFLRTERLEEEGIVIRSGLTPTDMMVLKGDFPLYDKRAASAALACVAWNSQVPAQEIPDRVYELVVRKLYRNLARILLTQSYPRQVEKFDSADMERVLDWFYSNARESLEGGGEPRELRLALTTDYPLVGVGAPIHIFLPAVARLLGTEAVIPEHAEVANALGAIASRVVTKVLVRIKAEYKSGYCCGYSVFEGVTRHMFQEYEDAEAFAVALAQKQVMEKTHQQGASGSPEVTVEVQKIRSAEDDSGVLFETVVQATATDSFRIRGDLGTAAKNGRDC